MENTTEVLSVKLGTVVQLMEVEGALSGDAKEFIAKTVSEAATRIDCEKSE